MTKPLALISHFGANKKMTWATSLVATEFAAMAQLMEERGYQTCSGWAVEETNYRNCPSTGLQPWDGITQPDIVFLHQAPLNCPGGLSVEFVQRLEVLAEVLPKAKQVCRVVIDNTQRMRITCLLKDLASKARMSSYSKQFREKGPNPLAAEVLRGLQAHVDNGTYSEIGYEAASDKVAEAPFEPAGLFSRQLLLTRDLFSSTPEKDIDFCCVATSRGNPSKSKARLDRFPEGLLQHENSAWIGSLFEKKWHGMVFPGLWDKMCRSKGHIVIREPDMAQLPLHRYLQALVCEAVPIVLGETECAPFIHHPELQRILRVGSYAEARFLIDQYEALKPLLKEELDYWVAFDQSLEVS